MPIKGLFHASASAFAVSTPIKSDPISPGPCATATASMFSLTHFVILGFDKLFGIWCLEFGILAALPIASAITGKMLRTCSLAATSGTTPPYFFCKSTEEATTLLRTFCPSSTTAAPVSSQVVSNPSILIVLGTTLSYTEGLFRLRVFSLRILDELSKKRIIAQTQQYLQFANCEGEQVLH